METINTIKEAAIKAVWGTPDANEEPVSGRMGNTAAGEPYDAGNIEPISTALKVTNPNPDVEPASTPLKPSITQSETMTNAEFNKNANPSAASAELPPPTPSEKPAASNSQLDTNPAEAKPASSLPGDATHAQSDTRSPTSPLATHHSDSEKDRPHPRKNVDDSGEGIDKSDNPVKIDGPGPRPLEVVAKEHGGDAGAVAKREKEKEKGQRSSSVDTQEDHESGTGGLYTRSSGLAADGGDFDAAKPGAGREADRLLAEERRHTHPRQTEKDKGNHKHHIPLPHHRKKDSGYEHGLEDEKDKTTTTGTANNGSAVHGVKAEDADVAHNWEIKSKKTGEVGKEKTSLKEKIKNKLHRSSVSSD